MRSADRCLPGLSSTQSVQILPSTNGEKFYELGTIENIIQNNQWGTVIQKFSVKKRTKARYIKVIAKNI